MAPKVDLECEFCGIVFTRLASEARRNSKRGRRIVCSRECQGKLVYEKLPETFGNSTDEYSQFRVFMKTVRWQSKKSVRKAGDIDERFLKELWEKQDGICPYTGWKLTFKKTACSSKELTPNRASLDRIDSSRGYTKDNVQFVAYMYQIAKNKFTDEQVMEFCKAVSNESI